LPLRLESFINLPFWSFRAKSGAWLPILIMSTSRLSIYVLVLLYTLPLRIQPRVTVCIGWLAMAG
jgi:hypothetical protein